MAAQRTFTSIDPSVLPRHFDSAAAEKRWDDAWQRSGIYRYDPTQPREATFVVDTPPPTVSGSLHVGHVFSYTHPDVVVRFQRMRKMNIFYPMGWDDNGLPTERRVQNYFHVRCEPSVETDAPIELREATAAERKGPPRLVTRPRFIELCRHLTELDEQAFCDLFRRLGLSVDWRQTYATIDERCRKLAQLSFLDLFEKGLVYQQVAPTMWDVDFQTAVAQAEVQDRPKQGAYHHIEFGVENAVQSFVIATTRPELLPACVGITAHPNDARYRKLFGKRAVTPIFRVPVPIFPSTLADPEKGSGILMVCTFGDQTDVTWWREQGLALRQIVTRNGRLEPVEFGGEAFPSLDAAAANRAYAELAGKTLNQARQRVVDFLRDPACSATGRGAPLQREPEPIQHTVKFYEKGDRPLEFLSTRQWFVKLLENKQGLLDEGARIHWRPEFMHARYRDWTENLNLDWCVSRQRYFGVPIPVWFRLDGEGKPVFDSPIVAARDALPVDPTSDVPPGYAPADRGAPGGFTGETDIFDTWFTSSLTPQIGSGWLLDPERHARLFPADVRPQAHEIIRTWAFYTIAKAHLHEGSVPWHNVMISGWILDPDRKKMAKSKGNVITPMHLFDEFGVDAVRYWAASARLGADTAFDEKVFKIGRRLVTKLFNAGKFVLSQGGPVAPISHELDRAFVAQLATLVASATRSFEEFKFAQALQDSETFFWTKFTDTFIELSKPRAWGDDSVTAEARGSALAALRLGLAVLLRLFAPFLPYITEEVWSWAFAKESGRPSIHVEPWPSVADFAGIAPPDEPDSFAFSVACFEAINKAKSDASVSTGRVVKELVVAANPATLERAAPVLDAAVDAARCERYLTEADPALEPGSFVVRHAIFAEKSA